LPDTLKDDPDQALVDLAAGGDIEAFEHLVRRHQSTIFNLIRSLVGPRNDIEDLAQEVFIRAYRFLATFRGETSFRSWLCRIAVNVTRSYHARRLQRRAVWIDGGEGTETSPVDRAADATSFEETLIVRNAVLRALAALPETLREVVVLRDVQGFAYDEIASVLGIPLGTVESRIFRARQRLRPLLGDLLGRQAPRRREQGGPQERPVNGDSDGDHL
jgi:RNA polymerase sigma-70 factor (ECF subfamily)